MKDAEIQNHLLFITKIKVERFFHCSKLRGVTAMWKDETAHISFYFSEKPTEQELEDASDVCTEIIASIPKGMMEENYIVLKYPQHLPEAFLAYKVPEKTDS